MNSMSIFYSKLKKHKEENPILIVKEDNKTEDFDNSDDNSDDN
jgi:hypothetical protein